MRRVFLLVITGACANGAPPATITTRASSATAIASAPASVAPVASITPVASAPIDASIASAVPSVTHPPAKSLPPQPGSSKCKTDSECVVSLFPGCCSCCPVNPYAASKTDEKRDRDRCNAVDCKGCDDRACEGMWYRADEFRAVCMKNLCTLVPR